MMTRIAGVAIRFLSLVVLLVQLVAAQSPAQAVPGMPRLVRFSGSVKGASGAPLSGVVGITILSNHRPAPRFPSASVPEVQANGNSGKVACFGSAGDCTGGHSPVLRNLPALPIDYVHLAC